MSQILIDAVALSDGVKTLLVPQTLAASAQGASYDASNLDVSTNAVLSVGAFGANSTSVTVQVEESADGSTGWAAIPGMVFTAATTSNQQFVVRGQRTNRYIRANAITAAGTTPSVACSVVLVSQNKYSPKGSGADAYPSSF